VTTAEKKERALEMGRNEIPVTQICRQLGCARTSVMAWLKDAGIEPTMLRKKASRSGGVSLANTPLALKLEEGARKRYEDLKRQEEKDARKKARGK
jgi:transposase-like protein